MLRPSVKWIALSAGVLCVSLVYYLGGRPSISHNATPETKEPGRLPLDQAQELSDSLAINQIHAGSASAPGGGGQLAKLLRERGQAALSSRFPQGLSAHAQLALQGDSGALAFELAVLLDRCSFVDKDAENRRSLIAGASNPSAQQYLAEELREVEWLSNECKALGGTVGEATRQLLEKAVQRGEMGAAAKLFVAVPSVSASTVAALRKDAFQGHLQSLALLAGGTNILAKFDPRDVSIARLALHRASINPTIRNTALGYLESAEKLAKINSLKLQGANPASLDQALKSEEREHFETESSSDALDQEVAKLLDRIGKSIRSGG